MSSGELPVFDPTMASDRLRRSVRFLFIGVFVVLASLLTASLLFNRIEALDFGKRRAENLAYILNGHLTRTIGGVDTMLSQLALVSSRIGGPNASVQDWNSALEAAKAGASEIAALIVLDAAGTIRHATLPQIVGQPRADTYLFKQLSSDSTAGIIANPPVRGQASGQWVIPFGRKLLSPDGKFAGIVVATLEPERLRGFYRTIDVGRGGFISVLHPEMAVLFREPSSTDSTGQAARDNPLLAQHKQAPEFGFVHAPFDPGGAVYLSAYRQVANPPLLIAVSLAESDILATWWATAMVSSGILAGFGFLLIVAWRVIMRETRARAGVEARIVAQSDELTAAIDKRAEADAALRTNEAQFQSIMQNAPMMVSLKDLEGRYTFVNQAFETFTGHSAKALLGKTVAEFRPPGFADAVVADDRAAIEGRHAVQREIVLPIESGERVALLVKFPLFDAHDKVTGVGTVMADITEQKRIEVQLAQSQRIEAVGQLTGGIAHDFNNLLTSILLNADVLVSLGDDKTRPLAEAVRMAAERGADLTRRLLAFGRRQMLEPRPTDIRDLLGGMEALMHRTLGEHIEIQFRHAADLWFAKVDPGQLENAVLNLAVNARDAMPSGGRLSVETANVELDAAHATANPEIKPGQYVMIAVGDSGIGMPPHVVERAFEPFFTTKDVGKGTGLGLSMVYGFVKQSGGHARMHSEVGSGTVVRLYLPRSEVVAAQAAAAPALASDLPKATETILFVEDDPMVRKHTGMQIVGLGYAIVAAENAANALNLVEHGCMPDLLFTDVVMPGGMNGRQLALRLRERWPRLRVLYTSGYAAGALTIDGEAVPAKYVLGKPYRRRDLAAKLREVLDEPVEAL
jgi:PAS domain S-box-containing protein